MAVVTVPAHQGDTVDNLCHRHLGSSADVERTLDLNPGLAALGPILPAGTPVTLPAASAGAATAKPLLQLWD